MNYSINQLKKYGVKLKTEEIVQGLINLGHEVEEVIDLNIPGLVIGEVVTCNPHPDSDKLNITTVNIGSEQLEIVCGAPNVRQGLKVIVATVGTYLPHLDLEIKPATIRNQVSNGMLCAIAELGFNKRVLNERDHSGICELPSDAPIGTDANQYLGIDDKILDVSLTADRGDCQNYFGVINDLKAYINYNFPQYSFTNQILNAEPNLKYATGKSREVKVEADTTIYYSAQEIGGVKVTDSDLTMQIFLMKHGIKPQNNVVDYSNYCLLTYGIPTHTFDSDKVCGEVIVKYTDQEQVFTALDGNAYTLSPNTLVICDQEKIIALAGVMGSDETKITEATTNVLLEIAIFDPSSVRLGAKNIGGKTDASIRYEKGVNYDSIDSIRSYLKVIGSDFYQPSIPCDKFVKKPDVEIDYLQANTVLGTAISSAEIKDILFHLDFQIGEESGQSARFSIPAHRHDIEFHNDLVEEVIRVYGIDKIANKQVLTSFNLISKITKDNSLTVIRHLEDLMLGYGLDQVVTYSLTSEANCNLFTNLSYEQIKLMHPISSERVSYRQGLIYSLIETAKYNLARQQKQSKLFEIGDTYYLDNGEVVQKRKLSGLITGENQPEYLGVKRNYDFYDLKAVVEQGLQKILGDLDFIQADLEIDNLNPYASCRVFTNGRELGYIAAVSPSYTKKIKTPVFVFELDLDLIIEFSKLQSEYQVISDAPLSERDLTITTTTDVSYRELLSIFTNVNYINEIKLIDIYQGENVESGHQAYTLKVIFGINGQTLTSEIVDEQVKIVVENIRKQNYQFKEQ